MMHRAKQVWQWLTSFPAKTWRRSRPLLMKLADLLRQARSQQVRQIIPPLGIAIGALAFVLWSQSIAAALFAGIGLFFLAGIYKTSERTLAAVGPLDRQPDARGIAKAAPENSAALNEAIHCLKPWLANEVPLTEEDVRDHCAVLVDSVVQRARQMTTSL